MKNRKLVKAVSALVLTLALVCLAAPVALAQPTVETGKVKGLVLEDAVTRVINWVLGILVLVTALMIVAAGVIWVTSAGNDTRVAMAKKILLTGIIGLIIALVAYGLIRVVTTVVLG